MQGKIHCSIKSLNHRSEDSKVEQRERIAKALYAEQQGTSITAGGLTR